MTTDTTQRYLIITTKPFPGEPEPQRWIVQPQAHFSVQLGQLGDDYPVRQYLDKNTKLLPEVRFYPVIPDAPIGEHIHTITRGTLPYSPGNPQPRRASFIHRKRELPEFHFECKIPQMPIRAGYCFPRPAYGQQLTTGQREILEATFADELTEGAIALQDEIIKRIRQQVIRKLQEEANDARKAAQKAEDIAKAIAEEYQLD